MNARNDNLLPLMDMRLNLLRRN